MLNKKSSFYSDIVIVLITVFSLCLTFLFINWHPINHPFIMDVNQYYSYLVAIFIDHDLSFTTNTHSFWLIETPTHEVVPKVTYGLGFFYSPFFLLAYLFSDSHTTGYEAIYAWSIHYGCILYILIGFLPLKKILAFWFNDIVIAVSLLLVFFASNLFYYTLSESESVHGILFFLISFFLFHVIKWQHTLLKKHFLSFMLAAGFICLVRPTECLVFVFPLLLGLKDRGSFKTKLRALLSLKWFLVIGIGLFALPILPQLIYWKQHTGTFLFFSYGNSEGFFWSDPKIINVFFSFKKGWLVYSPIMIFSLIGFVRMYLKNKELFYPVLIYVLLNSYLICSWWDWAYGGSFGMRAFIHCYAILIIPFAYFVQGIISLYKKSVIKTTVVYAFSVLGLFFCLLNVLQSNLYKHHIIHWDGMTKEAYQFTFLKKNYSEAELQYLKTLIKPPDYSARRKGDRDE
jgi:hypothetical protein